MARIAMESDIARRQETVCGRLGFVTWFLPAAQTGKRKIKAEKKKSHLLGTPTGCGKTSPPLNSSFFSVFIIGSFFKVKVDINCPV